MISKNPLKILERGSKERKDWDKLLDEIMELGVALAKSEGPDSSDIPHPWEDLCRDRYLEEEFSPDYRWRVAILLREKEEDIKKNKEKGSCNAKTEWEHLERTRSVDTSSSMKTGSSLVRSGDPEPENRSIDKPTLIAPDLARTELALANQNRENGSVGKSLSIIHGSSCDIQMIVAHQLHLLALTLRPLFLLLLLDRKATQHTLPQLHFFILSLDRFGYPKAAVERCD
jgi:hypothetical protein